MSLSAGVRALLNKLVCLIFSLFVKKPRNGTFTHERLRLRYFPAGNIQSCRCLTGGRKTPKLLCLVCSVLLCFLFVCLFLSNDFIKVKTLPYRFNSSLN